MSTKRAKSVNVPKPSIYFLVVSVNSIYEKLKIRKRQAKNRKKKTSRNAINFHDQDLVICPN